MGKPHDAVSVCVCGKKRILEENERGQVFTKKKRGILENVYRDRYLSLHTSNFKLYVLRASC